MLTDKNYIYEGRGNLKKKLLVFLLAVLCLGNFSYALASNSSAASYTITVQKPVHAWTGLHAYTVGAKGFYESNGTRITNFSTIRTIRETSGPWSSSSPYAAWTYKGTTSGVAYGEAFFILGVSTQWINLGFQSRTDSAQGTARANP
jgi:hypothetical protein